MGIMNYLLPGLGGLSSLFGGGTSTQTQTPTMAGPYQGIQGQLLSLITNRLNGGGLPAGYETGAIRNINNTSAQGAASMQNTLAAQGLSRSPIAANMANQQNLARTGQISTMQSQLPLLQRELQNQDISQAMGLMNFGRGSQTTSQGASGAAAGFGGLTDMMAYLYGKNPAANTSGWTNNQAIWG